MFYILHGEEEYTRSEAVSELRARVARDGMGDLNTTVLDGRRVRLQELMDACNTVPFLTSRRLVIVEGLLQRLESRESSRSEPGPGEAALPASEREYAERLMAYLPHLPSTARLVFVESKSIGRGNPILRGAKQIPGGFVREFKKPDAGDLREWIRHRATAKGVSVTRQAASLLASFVGDDLRLLDRELEKLAAFVDYARAITDEDVRALVGAAQEADIFALVDSLGLRHRKQAMQQLQRLLADGASDLYLLAMIARQIRLIIAVKDLVEEKRSRPDEIRRELRISHRFIVDKLLRQALRFDAEELGAILRRIVEIDQAIKTGRVEGSLALELLVLDICDRGSSAGAENHQERSLSRTR